VYFEHGNDWNIFAPFFETYKDLDVIVGVKYMNVFNNLPFLDKLSTCSLLKGCGSCS
jgi:hypothetical protein